MAARVPGLITGARDGFVVAAYLGLLFGAACSGAAFAISLIASSWSAGRSRRRRGLGLAAGTVFTLACLAYLTLWWDVDVWCAGLGLAIAVDADPAGLRRRDQPAARASRHRDHPRGGGLTQRRCGAGARQPGSSRLILAAAGA